MRIDNQRRYIKTLESAVIDAGKKILKEKRKKFIFMKYDNIQELTKRYMDGHNIRQASFHKEGLSSIEYTIVKMMKIALNQNSIFVYEKDIINRIKAGDKTIILSFGEKDES